jgi:hypothetical protein
LSLGKSRANFGCFSEIETCFTPVTTDATRSQADFFDAFENFFVTATLIVITKGGVAVSTKKPIQKVAVACTLVAAVIAVTEGYLRVREFVVEVHDSSRQIAVLKQAVETLQITLDNTPHTSTASVTTTGVQFAPVPVPEPMSGLPLPPPAPGKAAKPVSSPAIADTRRAPKDPDDDHIILLKEIKSSMPGAATSAQTPAAVPAQDVRLLSDRK